MKELDEKAIENSELVVQTFKFWLTDNEHIRCPFPDYIHKELKSQAILSFGAWAKSLNPKAKDEVNDEIVAEKFEEIIFETALKLVQKEDERITILYPFLPRLGDKLDGKGDEIIKRTLIKEKDVSYLKIRLINPDTLNEWETKFELPL